MREDEIKEVYDNEEDISKITEKLKLFLFDDFIKTNHFYDFLNEKAKDILILKENFKDFKRIKLINKRKHRNCEVS